MDMEPITAFGIYLTISLFSMGMFYYHEETHAKRIYQHLE